MARADNFATPRTKFDIELKALAWRYAFGCQASWCPDIVRILEYDIYEIDPDYTFRVMSLEEMHDNEGYTSFAPYEICIREDVCLKATHSDGRARFTLAHELGHYVLHSGEGRPRAPTLVTEKIQLTYMSSEWQANTFAAHFLCQAILCDSFPQFMKQRNAAM
jgi:hypothetical protein